MSGDMTFTASSVKIQTTTPDTVDYFNAVLSVFNKNIIFFTKTFGHSTALSISVPITAFSVSHTNATKLSSNQSALVVVSVKIITLVTITLIYYLIAMRVRNLMELTVNQLKNGEKSLK